MSKINRVVLLVLDSVGIGELPDAAQFGDQGSNTLGNISNNYPSLDLPNLTKLGLGNIDINNSLKKSDDIIGAYGKANEISMGKDTTTGHWEICGSLLDKAFPTYPKGFPLELMDKFEKEIGTSTIGNISASGTTIINDLGDEHLRTRQPIVYTSADSVFQIAMHEELYSIEEQYRICKVARDLLVGEHAVGRVIARPFIGTPGQFTRTSNRKDFSRIPPPNLLTSIVDSNKTVYAIGKISDIFADQGISVSVKTKTNAEGIQATINAIQKSTSGLIFTNLVDFDMLYGHRRDVEGYAKCLMEFDQSLPKIINSLKKDDLLIITADHGNDPTAPGTDHTREYIPILSYGQSIRKGAKIDTRNSFSDIAATIAEALKIPYSYSGNSFYSMIAL